MRLKSSSYLRFLPGVIITATVVMVIALLIWLKQILSEPVVAPKLKAQQVVLIKLPPPPPPPPPKQEPPPEPEQVETPQDEPEPDMPDDPVDDAPAGDDLGLDADGGVGGDGFGLVGRKGGRGLIGGGGDAKGWYARRMQQGLLEFFNAYKDLRKINGYSVELTLWLDASGRVERYQVGKVSGEVTRDLIQAVMADLTQLDAPPEGTPQPIRFRLSSRG